MTITLALQGEHLHLASPEEINAGLHAAQAVFAQHRVDPGACAAASQKMERDEALSKDEALLCVIWDSADDKAYRAVTLGWMARNVDIRLVPGAPA